MRIKPDVSGLIASLVIILITLALFFAVRGDTMKTDRAEVSVSVSHIQGKLENSYLSTIHSINNLFLALHSNPSMDPAEFEQISSVVTGDNPQIVRIVIIRGETISHVFPLKGNEKLIGTRPAVDYTNDIKFPLYRFRMTPFTTVGQDGDLMTRIPLYTYAGGTATHPRLWGRAEIVLDRIKFLKQAGIDTPENRLKIAIRQTDDISGISKVLVGSDYIFHSDPVLSMLTFPGCTWEIAAIPSDGWAIVKALPMVVLTVGFILAFYCAYLLTGLEKLKLNLKDMSYHDVLTGLPNRTFFNDRLSMAIAHARRNNNKVAVIMIDLDRFNYINETYGYRVGDMMLQKIAQRLLKIVRETDSVIRLGDDEFTLVLPGIKDKEDADVFEEKLQLAFKAPFLCGKLVLHVGINLGRAIFPDDGDTIDHLLKTADLSLFQAKNAL